MTPRDRRATLFVPVGIAVALAVTMASYAGMHRLIYHEAGGQLALLLRPESARPHGASGAAPGAFWRSSEHYHGAAGKAAPGAAATSAMMTAMDRMHSDMNAVQMTGDVDRDFTALMIPHHRSAVEMARAYLHSGRDPELRRLSESIIASQEAEIRQLRGRSAAPAGPAATAPTHRGH